MNKKNADRKRLEQAIARAMKHHNRAHSIAVDAINDYLSKHPEGLSHAQQHVDHAGHVTDRAIAQAVEAIAGQAAWIHDRLAGMIGSPGMPGYDTSLSKKIRKALGYTL